MCAASDSPSRTIETFVFMDLEATGLCPTQPKIAEMCLIAVTRHALANPQYSISHPKPIPLIPRLADKLCVCINPNKPFTPTASSITGLTNIMFSRNKKQSFNAHLLHMMIAFFNRQHPPICLVAHNGGGYDFPLLKAELSALGLPGLDGIYCADTLEALKALDKKKYELHQFMYEPTQYGKKTKYGLSDLYFEYYKTYPMNSHSAEGDVLTLISVFQQRARDLLCWIDSNARPFNTTRAMYEENKRYLSFSQTPEKIQQTYPDCLQIRSQQQGAQSCSFSHDDTEPLAYNGSRPVRTILLKAGQLKSCEELSLDELYLFEPEADDQETECNEREQLSERGKGKATKAGPVPTPVPKQTAEQEGGGKTTKTAPVPIPDPERTAGQERGGKATKAAPAPTPAPEQTAEQEGGGSMATKAAPAPTPASEQTAKQEGGELALDPFEPEVDDQEMKCNQSHLNIGLSNVRKRLTSQPN